MARKRSGNGKPIQVVMEHVPAPDAPERLLRAFALILRRAAAWAREQAQEVPAGKGPAADVKPDPRREEGQRQ